jgi:GWxTD domain-containing protein
MRFLESWVMTPLAQALGWTLLHSLWEGAIISACLATALWATRSARARYVVACVAMLVMLGGISITLNRVMPERVQGLHRAETTDLLPWNVPPDSGAAGPSGSRLVAIVPWLAPFWIAGVWILAFGQLGAWFWLSRLRRRGVCCAPEHWQQEIDHLCTRLRVSKSVRILESCLADVPMVIGHIRPVILIPIGLLAGLPPRQIEAILLHELAHIRRYDYLVNLLQRAVECLLFYHPAVWWISRVIRAERENCCDDVVVATSGDAHQYAMALTALAKIRWSGGTPAIAATEGSLVRRIRRLLYPNGANGVWTPLFAATIVITSAVVTLAAWPAELPQQNRALTQRQRGRPESSSCENWPKQEVAYIITDRERAAFKELTTDKERKKFIEQFWERRNPNPSGPENKFKEEYYRRVTYANQNFTTTSKPGWRTNRGYLYIAYGPPDTIAVTEYGTAPGPHVPYGIQVWTYRHVEGVGDNLSVQFMDTTGKGDYELPPAPSFKPAHKSGEAQPRKYGDRFAPHVKGSAETSPYDKWLNEEVPYIATDEERDAFQRLTTDEEREMFVVQFWDRRNPNPGRPENEFREEYYRRIAWTNKRWSTDKPGWKTDRGHLYIMFGPPDEIDSHPSGPPYPFEEWRYAYIKGLGSNVVFKLIDPKKTGEYHVVSPLWKSLPELHVPPTGFGAHSLTAPRGP